MEMKTFFLNIYKDSIKTSRDKIFSRSETSMFYCRPRTWDREFTVEAETGRILIVTSPQI